MSSAQGSLVRRWVARAGGSCDVRMGAGAIDQASRLFKGAVGTPRACLLVTRDSVDKDLTEECRRQLVDAGFAVSPYRVGSDAAPTLAEASCLASELADEGLTADDLCCVVGDADLVSMASYVCDSWCGGMSLVVVPTDETALLEGALLPRPLGVGAVSSVVAVRPCARQVLLDYDVTISALDTEQSAYLRAQMVASAMAASERAFSDLWDRTEAIMAGDEQELRTQLMEAAKQRGQASASTAVAMRQSVDYGQDFARALREVVPGVAPSTSLAEGLRFSARVSVAMGKLSLDDMLAQDELLDALGIGTAQGAPRAEELVGAFRALRLRRSNRILMLVPLAVGRVRPTSVPEDLMQEHAEAWCAAHRGA